MKRCISFIITFVIILMLPIVAYADEEYDKYLSSYDLSAFEDKLDSDTYDVLQELGLADFDYERISSLSLKDILSVISDVVRGKSETPLKSAVIILVYVLLSSFFRSMHISDDDSLGGVYSTASSLIISAILLYKISGAVTASVTAISVSADFMYAFVPIFCLLVASSGGVSTAFSTNTFLLALSQGLAFMSSNIFVPAINCFLAVSICSSVRSELNLDKLVSTMKQVITTVISVVSASFVSILSIKTAVASKADAIGLRSVRFAINSVVPVIGSAISEGLLSISSYSSLIRSSVGIVGIIAVALVFIPPITEVVIWRLVLSVCSLVSDIFGDSSVSLTLKSFRDTMLLINVVLILSMLTTVISIGILVSVRTG